MADYQRAIEDGLREEYFTLLPEIRRVAEQIEAEVRYHLLPISRSLGRHEHLAVNCRVKDFESALEKLRARQEFATFDRSRPQAYTLAGLNDLAGVRVLAFPPGRLVEIDRRLREVFPSWNSDPVKDDGEVQALKILRLLRGKRQSQRRIPDRFHADRHVLGGGACRDL